MAARIRKQGGLSEVGRNKTKKKRPSNLSICIHTEKPVHKLKTKQLANGKRLLQHGDTEVIINTTPITGGMEGTIHEAELVGDSRRRWIAKRWTLDPARLDPRHQRMAVIAEIRMHLLLMTDPRLVVQVVPRVCLAGLKERSFYLVMERFDGTLLRFLESHPEHAPTVLLKTFNLLVELQKIKFMHRDLHSENIVVTWPEVRLIDLSASRVHVPGLGPLVNPSADFNGKQYHGNLDATTLLLDLHQRVMLGSTTALKDWWDIGGLRGTALSLLETVTTNGNAVGVMMEVLKNTAKQPGRPLQKNWDLETLHNETRLDDGWRLQHLVMDKFALKLDLVGPQILIQQLSHESNRNLATTNIQDT